MATHNTDTIHYSELPPASHGNKRASEWETYRREVGRLIAEGHEGKWVLIKSDKVIDIFPSEADARVAGYGQFQLDGFLIHQIMSQESVIKSPKWMYFQCPDSASQSDEAAGLWMSWSDWPKSISLHCSRVGCHYPALYCAEVKSIPVAM